MTKTTKALVAAFVLGILALVSQAAQFTTQQPGLFAFIVDHEGKAWRKAGVNKRPLKQFKFIVVQGQTQTVHPDDHQYLINLVRGCVRDELRNKVQVTEYEEGVGGGYVISIDGTDWRRMTHVVAELVMANGEWPAREQLKNEMRSQNLL